MNNNSQEVYWENTIHFAREFIKRVENWWERDYCPPFEVEGINHIFEGYLNLLVENAQKYLECCKKNKDTQEEEEVSK